MPDWKFGPFVEAALAFVLLAVLQSTLLLITPICVQVSLAGITLHESAQAVPRSSLQLLVNLMWTPLPLVLSHYNAQLCLSIGGAVFEGRPAMPSAMLLAIWQQAALLKPCTLVTP